MSDDFELLGDTAVDQPSKSDLAFLGGLNLTEDDLELLLGGAPGLGWSDFQRDLSELYHRLRNRTAQLVCSDGEMRASVRKAVEVGAEAAWLALLGAFGLNPGTLAARALKPIAVGVVHSGVEGLCKYA